MISLQGLTLFWGLYVATVGRACATEYISNAMRNDIKALKDHWNASDGDKSLFGNPLFLRHITNVSITYASGEQKLLLKEILDVYSRILENMMEQAKGGVSVKVASIKGRIDNLRRHFYKNRDLKKMLQDIWAIKVEDSIVQRKAVRELMFVYQEASNVANKIVEKKENKRKRRQLHKQKKHGF